MLSALSIPSTTDKLGQLAQTNWAELEECENARDVRLKSNEEQAARDVRLKSNEEQAGARASIFNFHYSKLGVPKIEN
jgi:hypothetical protein